MLGERERRAARAVLPPAAGAARLFAALGERSRLRIVFLLERHGELCVTDIAEILGVTLPAASQHLRILELAGLLEKERMGNTICYRLRSGRPIVRPLLRILALALHEA